MYVNVYTSYHLKGLFAGKVIIYDLSWVSLFLILFMYCLFIYQISSDKFSELDMLT